MELGHVLLLTAPNVVRGVDHDDRVRGKDAQALGPSGVVELPVALTPLQLGRALGMNGPAEHVAVAVSP